MISGFLAGASRLDAAPRTLHSILPSLSAGICAAGLGLVAISGSVQAQTANQPANQSGGPNITQQVQKHVAVPLPSLSPIVDAVMPAVVNISVVLNEQEVAQNEEEGSSAPRSPLDEFLRRFFEQQGSDIPQSQHPHPRPGHATALGSGFIIDEKGDIVTNNHVVGHAEKVTVVFSDNTKHPARIVGRDEQTDIALVKIDTDKPLPFVAWGDSDAAKVGDWVVAVGNPFGLGGTVTSGIISALGRNIEAGPYDDFLQIDASINRGNSGGPTFNLNGEVIGINTAIYSPSGGSVGIGFAVPSALAKNVVAQLNEHGHVIRGWLGVQIQNITPEIARSLGLSPENPKGALVADVTDNSPAAKAQLKPGDAIIRFNGKEIRDVHDLSRLVAETPVGQNVDIAVLRNGKEQHVQTTIAESSERPKLASTGGGRGEQGKPKQTSALGLQLSPLSDDVRKQADIPPDVHGIVVRNVAPDSPAAGLVEPGDVIVSINEQQVTDPTDAAKKLQDAAANKQALLLVNHRGTNRFVGLPLAG